MSTFSSDLKIELIGTGEQSGVWGTTTNSNFSNVFEQALVGRVSVPFTDANVTLTATDTVNSQSFRRLYLNCTGANTASRDLIVPTINKTYVVQNNTTGSQDIVIKTSAGTGVTVPNGKTVAVYVDGTNVIQSFDYVPTLGVGTANVTTLNVTTIDTTNLEVTNIKAKDGTAAMSIADSTGIVTISSQLNVDNLNLSSNTISSTDANGNIVLAPNGTGDVQVDADTLRVGDSGSDATIQSNGNADLILKTGNATTGTVTLADGANGNLTLALNGTGQVVVNAGAVGTPTIAPTGDLNTGIFFPSADTIAFTEGGAEAMRITSAGAVGIGTTNPPRDLSIARGSGVEAYASFSGNGAANPFLVGMDGAGLPRLFTESQAISFWTTSTERMRIDSSGNVGIGTTSPTFKLEVTGATGTNGDAIRNVCFTDTASAATGVGGGIAFGGNYDGTSSFVNDFAGIQGFKENSTAGNYAGALRFTTRTNGGTPTERARITSGGYFKASNDTSIFVSPTGNYHEFGNTVDNTVIYVRNSNASFSNSCVYAFANRTASTAYYFYRGGSDNGGDDEFLLRGDGNAYADGTWNNNGADYAEFFESANGQALTLGATVVLDGNKVREATDQDPASAIIGVVRPKEPSKASMVVGNTAWNKWANKYLTDDFDRYIMEDHDVVEWEEQVLEREAVAAVEAVVDEEGNEVSPAVPAQEATYKTVSHSYESHNIPAGITVPTDATVKTHDDKGNKFQHYKLNPAWDKDAEYVNRENRPEWNIIGLVGQVKVLKGRPTNDRWIKMRDVSANVEEWFIR